RRRDPDRIRLGERFQTRGDIDAVAQQIVTVDDHIAEMDADAEPHRSSFGIPRCVRSDRILYCYCALHGGDCAGEIRHHAVAGGMKDAAAMLRIVASTTPRAAFSRAIVPTPSSDISRL